MFEREDWVLFMSLGTLGQKAGVTQDRLAEVVIKELVDNALDAGADPALVEARYDAPIFVVRDHGPGIAGTDVSIAELFSIRRPLRSSKLLRLPTRGALGNGLRVVIGAVIASGGGIEVSTRGRSLTLAPQRDGSTLILECKPWVGLGTEVRLRLGPTLNPSEKSLYLGKLALRLASLGRLPEPNLRTSVHWYTPQAFEDLLRAWTGTLGALLAHVQLARGRGADGDITEGYSEMSQPSRAFETERIHQIHAVLRAAVKAPKPTVLGEIGPLPGHAYGKKVGDFRQPTQARAIHDTDARIPVVVEAYLLPCSEGSSPSCTWLVNRSPVVAPGRIGQGERSKWWISGANMHHYVKIGKRPCHVMVNVTSPYMPITTDGKEPDFNPFAAVVLAAIEVAARKLPRASGGSGFGDDSGDTQASRVLAALPEAIAIASGDGAHRYSLRQLYYAVRPLAGTDLSYNYFGTIVTSAEADKGADLPGVYRDARGVLYHPHTGEQTPLGTLAVEEYRAKKYAFNKVLYIEKGGFLPLLLDAKWPERHDCAILTSQGFASRAARDVIDLLGDGDEPIQFFCVHDADGPGGLIFEKLTEATQARRARRVEIHNLGLDPWEGHEMGLQAETFERKKGRVPIAGYVQRNYDRHPNTGERWSEWLQTQRYELNAMSSPVFLRWLDEKIAPFEARAGGAKVVPPNGVLRSVAEEKLREASRKVLLDNLAREAKLDEQVADLLATDPFQRLIDGTDRDTVRATLDLSPASFWETAVAQRMSGFAKAVLATEEE